MANVGIRPAIDAVDQQIFRRVHAFVVHLELRVTELLLVTTLPGSFVAAKTFPSPRLVVCTLVAGTLSLVLVATRLDALVRQQ